MRPLTFIILTLALALGFPAAAKPPAPREDTICVTVKHLWRGSPEDVRAIAAEPVPQSYRDQYSWGGCQWLAKENLIDWHLAFGDERSTTAALDFLTRTALEGMPTTAQFIAALPAAWRAAGDAASRQAATDEKRRPAIRAHTGPSTVAQRQRFLGTLRETAAVRRLRLLVEARRRYAFLAAMHLQAAEFFRSKNLLDGAAPYLGALANAQSVLQEGEAVGLQKPGTALRQAAGIYAWTINEFADLEMRASVLQAELSRSPADIAAATATIARHRDRTMEDAADRLYRTSGDICDDEDASEALRTSCRTENDLLGRLRDYWRSKAHLDLLTAPEPDPDSFDIAWRAIDADTRRGESDPLPYDSAIDEQTALLLAKADAGSRATQALERSANPPDDGDDADDLRRFALADLVRAERFVSPARNPNRFRQIGERYLVLFAAMSPEARGYIWGADHEAAYFRQLLPRLTAIAEGRG